MTPDNVPLNAIYHAIQLAIAPVFLLTAIGTFLNALTGRLARAVDRRRQVEELLPAYDGEKRESLELELQFLQRRTVLVIRGSDLLTADEVVGDEDVLEVRPVMSGGSARASASRIQ